MIYGYDGQTDGNAIHLPSCSYAFPIRIAALKCNAWEPQIRKSDSLLPCIHYDSRRVISDAALVFMILICGYWSYGCLLKVGAILTWYCNSVLHVCDFDSANSFLDLVLVLIRGLLQIWGCYTVYVLTMWGLSNGVPRGEKLREVQAC